MFFLIISASYSQELISYTKVSSLNKSDLKKAWKVNGMPEFIVNISNPIDLYEVIRAASTKPFGFVPYYPGPGLGGHCIPIDPFYLTWKAKEYGLSTKFIELAGEINENMPQWVFSKVINCLFSS